MRRLAPLLAALVLGGCASWFGGEPPAKVSDGVFVDPATARTLYTYDRDPPGKSVCLGPCAIAWPPLLAPEGAKTTEKWTVITRPDGGRQWAYKGKALYAWSKDTQPGERAGDGVNNLWRVARP
jgi:predicted lipoprotein with Yx(FWY)xxD motif